MNSFGLGLTDIDDLERNWRESDDDNNNNNNNNNSTTCFRPRSCSPSTDTTRIAGKEEKEKDLKQDLEKYLEKEGNAVEKEGNAVEKEGNAVEPPAKDSPRQTPIQLCTPTSHSQSQTLTEIQNVFTDSQKIAYVGLCSLSIQDMKKRLEPLQKAHLSYVKWSQIFMEKLYVYLDIIAQGTRKSHIERLMIENLASHGLIAQDLSSPIVQEMENGNHELDIRYTILSHLFLLSICDGNYDSRSRSILLKVAQCLDVPYLEVVKLENCIANELRLDEQQDQVKHDDDVVVERNQKEGEKRWMYAGLVTLGGATLIGVTAGLAAPFIGAGIGAALTTFGVAQGAVVGSFMGSAGGIALITGGGVLTGGGIPDFLI
jgi:hypothetical protein